MSTEPVSPATEHEATLAQVIGRLAFSIDKALDPGDVASLRRWRVGQPPGTTFHRLAATHLQDNLPAGPARDEAEDRWCVIAAALAELRGMHRPGLSLGRVLAQLPESRRIETRFVRLLRAHDRALADATRVTAHFLAAKGASVDVTDLARLVLSDGRSDEDQVRRRVARAFYSHSKP